MYLKKCITNCSTTQNTHYDSDTDKCVSNCTAEQISCGDVCISNVQKCCSDGTACNQNEDSCSGICYNTTTQQCINNTIYDNSKVCNSTTNPPVICITNQQCNNENTACISCPDGQSFCKESNTCCDRGYFCENGGCTKCKLGESTTCGNTCCKSTEKCGKDKLNNSVCITCDHDLCPNGQTCCQVGQTCMPNGGCCDTNNVYNGGKQCCENKDGLCGGNCCGSSEICHNDKCTIACGDTFCDPDLQECIQNPTTNKFYCNTRGCEWDSINYDPINMITSKQGEPVTYIKTCKISGGTNSDKFYVSQPVDTSLLSRIVFDHQTSTKINCNTNDCIGRLTEEGIDTISFS